MIPYAELEKFFCDLVAKAQDRGIPCAITSGMACVHFGSARGSPNIASVAETRTV